MSLSPRPDSDKSEFQTNISLIARVRDPADVKLARVLSVLSPAFDALSAVPGTQGRFRERRDPGRVRKTVASTSQVRA